MKKKWILIIVGVFLLLTASLTTLYYLQKPDGSTIESRELLLNENHNTKNWLISKEVKVKNYIFSGIYSGSKSGIAIYENTKDDNYKLVSTRYINSKNIIHTGTFIDNEWYDISWFNGAITKYAEFIYTGIDGKVDKVKFETDDMNILYNKSSVGKEYSLKIIYYDEEGNMYE